MLPNQLKLQTQDFHFGTFIGQWIFLFSSGKFMPLNVNLTPLSPAWHARFPPSTFSCHYLLIIAVYTYMQMIRHGSNKLHVQWLKGLKLLILKIDLDTMSQHLAFRAALLFHVLLAIRCHKAIDHAWQS